MAESLVTDRASGRVLDVRDLHVGFERGRVHTSVVDGISFALEPGQCLALVGESGSGKSVTARTIIGLAGYRSRVRAERIDVRGASVLGQSNRQLRSRRGVDVGFVLQDALASLDPLRPVGREIEDALRLHTKLTLKQRRIRVRELLERVGMPEPQQRARQRSGDLSGGLRQRALIASAIALDPPLIIADEPTTALDATVQEQILLLLEDFKRAGTAILVISHDLAVVSRIADSIAVMSAGRIVEQGRTDQILSRPAHDYTRQLIQAVPAGQPRGTTLSGPPSPRAERGPLLARNRRDPSEPAPSTTPSDEDRLIEATDLIKRYRNPDGSARLVLDEVSFTLRRGRTLGLVGESGSGKTTAARIVLGLTQPDSGTVTLSGQPWSAIAESARRPDRWRIGAIYQDPLSSFDPRLTVNQILIDAITSGRSQRGSAHSPVVSELLDAVGLSATMTNRRPLHLSGGQRQRVAIARALAAQPQVIVCDEPVSALDVSVQAQVLDLLDELQRAFQLSYLFISHDLGVVQHVSDEVAVMSQGCIVEHGAAGRIFTAPQHPYTKALLQAAPRIHSAASLISPSKGRPA